LQRRADHKQQEARVVKENGELSKEFIERQRERLEQLRRQLLEMHGETQAEARQLSRGTADDPRDMGDEGANRQQHEIDESRLDVAERRLRDVGRALEKIEEGTYGLSDESGEPILKERLEAIPEAIYTVEEMSRREMRRIGM
jgi:DnaK suppressor protein